MGIVTLHVLEDRRLQEQTRLNALKSARERNRLGQFATPPELALSLARYARALMGSAEIRFLDPAIGTGSFFSAVLQAFGCKRLAAATGVELDPLFASAAVTLWEAQGLHVIRDDFTKQRSPHERYNLILANPPYVRHPHLTAPEKDRLRARLARSLRLDISGLAGLYCYFLLLCHDWMEDRGLAVWLIPSEFMDVNYGVTLRRYLTERVTLLHIHRFCPKEVQFTDALVSSAVVVFRKSAPPSEHHVRVSFADAIENPSTERLVPLDVLRHSRKWTQFPANAVSVSKSEPTLGDLFVIQRGLATGSNSFFILNDEQMETWHIPRRFLKPILPGERVSEGRVYGGGLHKVEPKELAKISARLVLGTVDGHIHIERQEKLFL